MSSTDEMQFAYCYGDFAGKIITGGIIHPDLQMKNIGFGKRGMKLIDFADAVKIQIPDDLSIHNINRLSSSLYPLFDSFPTYKGKSSFRAGFSARGGTLADIILTNCRNDGFASFSFLEKKPTNIASDFCLEQLLWNVRTSEIIKEWCAIPVEDIFGKNITSLYSYEVSEERNSISPLNRYFLDRYFYSCSYLGIPDDQLPALYANAGCSAFKYDKSYRAYGLLKKAIPMLSGKWQPMKQVVVDCFNKTIHTEKLNPEYMALIDAYIDRDYFELIWILDDLDAI
ncbi:MAG: hypothetical protein K2J47_09970 [Ruminococcus sp.]|nr:hypothetical protein [Ruminococcus sp.]